MIRRGFRAGIIALLCAYALLLHSFLSAAALTAHAAALAAGSLCGAQADDAFPAAPAPTSCAMHCLVAGLGCSGTLPAAAVAADVAASAVVVVPLPFPVLSRKPHKVAQNPRAPPSA